MEQQVQNIENQDPEEVNILRAVNRGETRLETVDWKTYLSEIVKMIGLMKDPISYIGCAWALLQEIDDYAQRADILSKWQDVAPQCFPTKEESNAFCADVQCLKQIYYNLRGMVVLQGAELPNTYDHVDGGKGLNEMALLWSDKYVSGSALVELASEIHKTVSAGNKDPLIEYFLYSSRNRNQLPFENIYDFSRNLFLAESFRQYLVSGKMYTAAPMTFGDFKRKLRNACFEEYIRLRVEQIREELDEDNWQLLDPTDEECYEELYKQEKSVYDRETMFEDFRGSQAYRERYFRGRPEVLNMMKYFMDYLSWKMENLHKDTMPKNQSTQIINGDYIVGNKYIGTVIEKVEAGGIGIQNVYGVQKPQRPAATPTNTEKRETTPFEPNFMTFTKERTSDYNIIALYQELLKVKWIEDGDPDEFAALFEGKNTECRITWSGKVGKDNLYALFKMMVDNHFIRLPEGHSLQRIVESHFVDSDGNYITGIDSGKPSKSALSTIEQMKKILAARQTFDD